MRIRHLLLVSVLLVPCIVWGQSGPDDVTLGATLKAFIDGSYGVGVASLFIWFGRALRAGGMLAPLLPKLFKDAMGAVPWVLAISAGLSTYGSAKLFLGHDWVTALAPALSALLPVLFGLILRGESDAAAASATPPASVRDRIGV